MVSLEPCTDRPGEITDDFENVPNRGPHCCTESCAGSNCRIQLVHTPGTDQSHGATAKGLQKIGGSCPVSEMVANRDRRPIVPGPTNHRVCACSRVCGWCPCSTGTRWINKETVVASGDASVSLTMLFPRSSPVSGSRPSRRLLSSQSPPCSIV